VVAPAELEWRHVLGAFQLTVPVRTKEVLLVREERELSVRVSPTKVRYVKSHRNRLRSHTQDRILVRLIDRFE
jgi:hypothetical protein